MLAEICAFALAILIIAALFLVLVYGPWWAKALAIILIVLVLILGYACLCVSSRGSRAEERRGRQG